MSQDEKWQLQYDQVMAFMEKNHRRPSKYYLEEKLLWHWFRRNIKLMNRGEMPADRLEKFKTLMEMAEKYRRVNQYANV